jgi:hypothetical protein
LDRSDVDNERIENIFYLAEAIIKDLG